MVFEIKIAGVTVEVRSVYERVWKMSKFYLVEGQSPDIIVTTSENDIMSEMNAMPDYQSAESVETVAVYRKIADSMLDFDIFLMHGAVIAVNNEAFMITAPSGVGKTTRVNIWLKTIPGSHILNGDKPLIKVCDNVAYACGTPWCGKENQGANEMLPLKAVFFLERSDENAIQELSFSEAFIPMLQQTYRPDSSEKTRKTLQLMNHLKGKVRFFRFCSNREEEAVQMAYAAATENT